MSTTLAVRFSSGAPSTTAWMLQCCLVLSSSSLKSPFNEDVRRNLAPKHVAKGENTRKVNQPSQCSQMACQELKGSRTRDLLAWGAFVIGQMGYRYCPKLSTHNAIIAYWLVRLTRIQ